MMMRSFLLLLCVAGTMSCSRTVSSPEEEGLDLFGEVMAIHDSVMPRMGEIRKIRKSLLEKAESSTDTALVSVLLNQADELDSAAQSMMGWMRQFNPHYYEEQKRAITDVRQLMNASIDYSNNLFYQLWPLL